MISTAVIPRLCKLLEDGALDVYSEKHVRRVIELSEEVEASLDNGNMKFQVHIFSPVRLCYLTKFSFVRQSLLHSVLATFKKAVTDTETLIVKYTSSSSASGTRAPSFHPDAIPARNRFLARRIKLLQNLLKWRKYTGERFGVGQLTGKFVDECLLNVAEGSWDHGQAVIEQVNLALEVFKIIMTDVFLRYLACFPLRFRAPDFGLA